MHVTGFYGFNPSLGHDALVFRGLGSSGFRADSRPSATTWSPGPWPALGPGRQATVLAGPQAAGDYVLWYDESGGHVAEFTG